MNQCDNGFAEYQDYFSMFIEGDLDTKQTKRIEAHLLVCPACRDTIQRMRALQESLQHLPTLAVSPDFDERLHQRLRQPGRHFVGFPIPAASRGWRLSAVAAAVIIVVGGGMMMFQNDPGQILIAPRQESSFSPSLAPKADGKVAAEGEAGGALQPGGEELTTGESDSLRDSRKKELRESIHLVNEKR